MELYAIVINSLWHTPARNFDKEAGVTKVINLDIWGTRASLYKYPQMHYSK